MTKLEQLWDDFPVRRPATSDLIRIARAEGLARRRKLVLRPVAVGSVAAAIATAFVLGTATGPSSQLARPGVTSADGPGALLPGSDASPVSFVTGLKAPSSCEALLTSYKTRGVKTVTAWGWGGGGWRHAAAPGLFSGTVPLAATAATNDGASKALTTSSASQTGTNVQEAGVDEPDLVKTDGKVMVRITGARLDIFDVTGPQVERTGTMKIPSLGAGNVLLSGSTVVVIGADAPRRRTGPALPGTRVVTVSITDPAAPRITHTTTFSAGEITARQSGSTIRLVLNAAAPALPFVYPRKSRSERQALRHNRGLIRNSTLADWLPTYDHGNGPQPLLDCDAVALPDDTALAPGTVAVVGFDAATPATLSGVGVATSTNLTYANSDRLYLAGTNGMSGGDCAFCGLPRAAMKDSTTPIFAFTLDGTTARHVASGSVAGYLRDRWSMDAVGDTLRVAVSGANATEVHTFQIDGTTLTQTGEIGGLGKGETLKSVRWFDDLALVVTFREVDPLYAIDLTDPAKPREISHLKALGYSTYLHPLDSGRVLGIGVTGILGRAKATLFDVSNLEAMREAGVVRFERGTYAAVGYETRAFTWLPDQQIALTPLAFDDGRIALAVIRVVASGLTESTVVLRDRYPTGGGARWSTKEMYDVSGVRTVEVEQGRVVVITPTSARFLPLP